MPLRRGVTLLPALLGALLCGAFSPPAEAQELTLEEALRRAQSASHLIRIKQLAASRARLARQEAQARLWPHVDLQASAAYLVNPPTGYTVSAGSLGVLPPPLKVPVPQQDFTIGAQPYDYLTVAATLTQPLFTWGKLRSAIEAGALQADAASTDLLAQRRDIAREVRRSYFRALLAQESQKVLRELAGAAAGIVADRRAALGEGTGTREQVLEAESIKAQIDARLVEAEQAGVTAREGLGILTGAEPSGIRLASGFPSEPPPLDEDGLQGRAREVSTDIAASRNRQEQARSRLDLERGGLMLRPDVSLGVSLSATGQQNYLVLNGSPPSSDASPSWTWDLVISVNIKMGVVDGREAAARVGQAEQDLESAGQALAQAQELTRLAVRRAAEAARDADAGLAEKLSAEAWAAEHLANAQVSFQAGVASLADLRSAQIQHGNAVLDRLLAQFTREEARAEITRLAGETP